jgi:hypothetical protein
MRELSCGSHIPLTRRGKTPSQTTKSIKEASPMHPLWLPTRRSLVLLAAAALLVALPGLALAGTITGTSAADVLRGGDDDDLILGRGGNDRLYGGDDDDRLYGGPGNDRLYGGDDNDRLYGGPGNDVHYTRDGERDYVACGLGRDTAYVDRSDRTIACEVVKRAAVAGDDDDDKDKDDDKDDDDD